MKRFSLGTLALSALVTVLLATACGSVDEDESVASQDQAVKCARCDDGNPCTTDLCGGPGGCTHVNNTNRCDDGNACTAGDVCSNGVCTGATYSCDDGNVCTTDSCDGSGGCNYVPNTNSCNDGNACTTGDLCSNGVCAGTIPAEQCTNGIDDDCDGLVDSADPDCPATCFAEQCTNGIDDDCDGLVDSADPDCPTTCIDCMAQECPWGYVCPLDGPPCCVSHCGDGVQNGDEGDVDCGGSCVNEGFPRCASGQHCWTDWDCASGVCSRPADVCQ